jgi:hypothetical protein
MPSLPYTADFAGPDGAPWPTDFVFDVPDEDTLQGGSGVLALDALYWANGFQLPGLPAIANMAFTATFDMTVMAATGYVEIDVWRVRFTGGVDDLGSRWVTFYTGSDDSHTVIRIYELDASGTYVPVQETEVPVGFTAPVAVRVEEDDRTVHAKLWPAGDPEPAGWDLTAVLTVGSTVTRSFRVAFSPGDAPTTATVAAFTVADLGGSSGPVEWAGLTVTFPDGSTHPALAISGLDYTGGAHHVAWLQDGRLPIVVPVDVNF